MQAWPGRGVSPKERVIVFSLEWTVSSFRLWMSGLHTLWRIKYPVFILGFCLVCLAFLMIQSDTRAYEKPSLFRPRQRSVISGGSNCLVSTEIILLASGSVGEGLPWLALVQTILLVHVVALELDLLLFPLWFNPGPKCWCPLTRLHGFITQKATVWTLTDVVLPMIAVVYALSNPFPKCKTRRAALAEIQWKLCFTAFQFCLKWKLASVHNFSVTLYACAWAHYYSVQ
jgi:hypothetical protein